MIKSPVYIRMKRKIIAQAGQQLTLQDIAYISATKELQKELLTMRLYSVSEKHEEYAVIDGFQIIQILQQIYPEIDCQQIGVNETIVHIQENKKKAIGLRLTFAWIILFIGTAMTIMNFHEDVSMQIVHQKIHFLLTSKEIAHPLWIQIPYSIGLGLGMILFLNHWFKKRFNEEPSPLEIELFTYQRNLDNYIAYYENDLNRENDAP